MIQIVTDSASDITLKQAEEMNVQIVPLTILFEDGVCPQETDEDFQIFYERLMKENGLPKTSQPTPNKYLEIFRLAKAVGDEVLVITLSGGLSGTVQSARLAKDLAEYERIEIIDSKQAILTQRMLVEYAVRLRDQGRTLDEITELVLKQREKLTVFGMLDTLTYLKKGGRIPASMALLGNLLRIKPVIILKNSVLEQLGKARGRKDGLKMLCAQMEHAEIDLSFPVYFGYTLDPKPTKQFQAEMEQKFQLKNTKLYPVGGVIGTHVGPNCVAVAFAIKEKQ
ncbi:DegV domain-containing protein [Clostridiales bacterium CHKCI001]|nr:DegV domain-containing protein [Clostridiales bacterium CHKCI001]